MTAHEHDIALAIRRVVVRIVVNLDESLKETPLIYHFAAIYHLAAEHDPEASPARAHTFCLFCVSYVSNVTDCVVFMVASPREGLDEVEHALLSSESK